MIERRSLLGTTLLLILIFAAIIDTAATPATASPPSSRRFGFGYVDPACLESCGNYPSHYSADTFFNAMFLTPPYPSTVMFIMVSNDEFASGSVISFLSRVMQLSSQYPSIQLGYEIAFDPTLSSSWVDVNAFLTAMSSSPYKQTVGFVGVDIEHFAWGTPINSSQEMNYLTLLQTAINNDGFSMVNLYPQALSLGVPYIGSWLQETTYPQGDNEAALGLGSGTSYTVGEAVGLDSYQPFPSPGCTGAYGGSYPGWSTIPYAEGFAGAGYNDSVPCSNVVTHHGYPATIDQALSIEGQVPLQNGQWIFLNAGNSGSEFLGPVNGSIKPATFLGVSNQTTFALWDSPVFRHDVTEWIQANPGFYLLGNEAPPSTSTLSSSSSTNSSISTTSSASTQTNSTTSQSSSSTSSIARTSSTSHTIRSSSSSATVSTTFSSTGQTTSSTRNQSSSGGSRGDNPLTIGAVLGGASAVLVWLVAVPVWLLRGKPKR
ncbi:MAG: hypothetical protein OK422_00260 [Thaumarchaeota archaeon]|nr:hypothetical protein [Nitrososphaerota archaeon]